ncbi:XdhC /CoxI family-like protein [Pelagibius litoralis]|uniref:XdhC /CoxI family-like protein n=1 Tax=Pelagibius litoralis TaxID=374515 RepID=A0A967C450_9PROT|nr:XdhC/CoxI family protein [Pelagibius litoralis]NIA68320.1 XdhC /CoxI family-like protein [Pelagibius litoralis]
MTPAADILDLVSDLKATGEAFALATVVRTVSLTAAKAGAKAVIRPDGTISDGWIGGGCAKSAVLKAAREAIADGKPRLVSVQPADLLQEQGLTAGEESEGVRFASNMCPSQGTMDIFVEPMLPKPELVVCGASPVAIALTELGRQFGYRVVACAPKTSREAFGDIDQLIDGFELENTNRSQRFIVVATQGSGDLAALRAMLSLDANHIAFVGSRKKMANLRGRLTADGVAPEQLDRVKAPAGLDLGAITPQEIALSIIAEVIQSYRQQQQAVAKQTA